MKEIRQQDDVVARAVVNIERAARLGLIAIRDSRSLRVFVCNFQYVWPIDGSNLGLRISLCERKAIQAMTGGDIENPYLVARVWIGKLGQQLRGHRHHRGHRARELHPHRVYWV